MRIEDINVMIDAVNLRRALSLYENLVRLRERRDHLETNNASSMTVYIGEFDHKVSIDHAETNDYDFIKNVVLKTYDTQIENIREELFGLGVKV